MSTTDEIVREFLVESFEHLDRLEADVLALEADPHEQATLGRLFRTLHTMKGTAGFLGFTQVEAVAHTAENLLGRLRDGDLVLDTDIARALLETGLALRAVLWDIEATGVEADDHCDDLARVVNRLQELNGDRDPKVGDILLARGVVLPEDISLAVQDQRLGDDRLLGEILVQRGVVEHDMVLDAIREQQRRRPFGSDESVRVDVQLLDDLCAMVEVLAEVTDQLRVATAAGRVAGREVETVARLVENLRAATQRTRVQPIGTAWRKFPRLVRHLGLSSHKQVGLVTEGAELEVDRATLEAIRDPLTHLVRNAVDHGIESPEDRAGAGKPAQGTVVLRAVRNGRLTIEVSDDGRGVDVSAIVSAAVDRGLLTDEEARELTQEQALELMCRPGVSTAPTITNLSGRGVGLDVLRANLDRIGGSVEIHTKPGEGTTFLLHL